jgi:hypothetical protein
MMYHDFDGRTHPVKTTILFGIAILCPLAALSAQEIKPFDARPGLWESTTTTEISGMPAMPAMPQLTPDQLARIPEAQRKQMEAMMAGRGGSPRSATTKSCVTKESLARSMAFLNDDNPGNCTRKIASSSSDKIEMHIECTPDKTNMTMTGDFTIQRVDAEHVKGSGAFKSTGTGSGGNAPRTMESKITFSTRYLSSDCGDVKPAGEK